MKQYKVLTQKDKWFSNKFDPAMLEEALNFYAREGWQVISSVTGDFPGTLGIHNEIIVILEREVSKAFSKKANDSALSETPVPPGKKKCPNCAALNNISNKQCFACNHELE